MPFIQPRLSSKAVESIWQEIAASAVCQYPGCTKRATSGIVPSQVQDTPAGYCDDHNGPPSQPKTAGAKVYKARDGKSWGVDCNTNDCRHKQPMEGLTYAGAEQQRDTHNQIWHSKTAADVNYGGGPGSDDPGINFNYADSDHEPKSDRLGTDATCDVCHKPILFDGFHGPMEKDDYGNHKPSKSWRHVVRASREVAAADLPDGSAAWGGGSWCNRCYGVTSTSDNHCVSCGRDKQDDGPVADLRGPENMRNASSDGPSELSESFRPVTHDEMVRLVEEEDRRQAKDRRETPRETPSRRQASRKTADVSDWNAIMQSPELMAVWVQVHNLASNYLSAQYEEEGIEDGISGSDINHTIFAYAQHHWDGSHLDVAGLIDDLANEYGRYRRY